MIESLFGGGFDESDDIIRFLDPAYEGKEECGVPGTVLPSGSSHDLFSASWDRWHYLKELGVAAVGYAVQPPSELTPQWVPRVLCAHFGRVISLYKVMGNIAEEEGGTTTFADDFFDQFPMIQALSTSWAGLNSTPFFIEAPLAAAILAMRPPDPDILTDLRMPAGHTCIILGAGFEITTDSGWWSDEELAEALADQDESHAALEAMDVPHSDRFNLYDSSLRSEFLSWGGRIRGVLLAADQDGFLEDHVTWLLESADVPDVRGSMTGCVNGKLTQSALAPLVHNLAATVAWGKWTPPPETPEIPQDLEGLEKVKNTGKFRRALRRGAGALGIHVIDINATRSSSERHAAEPSGRRMSPHKRRGHWRRVRIATRENGLIVGDVQGEHNIDWHYEGRHILPVIVNQALGQPSGLTVYRIPSRAEFEADDEED